MDPDVRAILLQADEADAWCNPHRYNYRRRFAAVEAVKPELEALTGVALGIDRSVQDASHLTDIFLRDTPTYDSSYGGHVVYTIFGFRFSNFAQLFTMWGTGTERRSDEFRLDECIELLSNRGFVYIPADQLEEPYDGVNRDRLTRPISWWIRYFDYL